MKRTDPKFIGEQTELTVLILAHRLGINVSIPWGDGLRYDQIWDVNGTLYRIQIKHARIMDDGNTIEIPGKSSTRKKGKTKNIRYTKDEVDAIVTVYKDTLYFIPIGEMSATKRLRFEGTKNFQQANINWARDYEVVNQLQL